MARLDVHFIHTLPVLAASRHSRARGHPEGKSPDVFDCEYAEIAQILGKSEAACRQIVHQARERVRRDRPRFAVSESARLALLNQFVAAMTARDQDALLALFAQNAIWTSDGGGQRQAFLRAWESAPVNPGGAQDEPLVPTT
jgi:hypothetical protein